MLQLCLNVNFIEIKIVLLDAYITDLVLTLNFVLAQLCGKGLKTFFFEIIKMNWLGKSLVSGDILRCKRTIEYCEVAKSFFSKNLLTFIIF